MQTLLLGAALALGTPASTQPAGQAMAGVCAGIVLLSQAEDTPEHGGGLNACGCHFNRKEGTCHCHRPRACGCACQPSTCK
ncbi:MAG: hypothetical protein J0H69_20205 [Burkholderiales bacterium]|nr:hypothetical protein [Burkholderiales bacterium]